MKTFDAKATTEFIVEWCKEWFKKNGPGCNAIVGISGGVDSSVVAAILCKALGKDRVIGIMMPNGYQHDQNDAKEIIQHLGIRSYECNIHNAFVALAGNIAADLCGVSAQTATNLPPRLRMATLYAYSQSLSGRVANTCNLSEDWVGYSTRYGDAAGDFAPLAEVTKTEVRSIGRYLMLPERLVEKTPIDGLTKTEDGNYTTDEGKLGFTYDVLDRYIRTGECADEEIRSKIDSMKQKNEFKLRYMDVCKLVV